MTPRAKTRATAPRIDNDLGVAIPYEVLGLDLRGGLGRSGAIQAVGIAPIGCGAEDRRHSLARGCITWQPEINGDPCSVAHGQVKRRVDGGSADGGRVFRGTDLAELLPNPAEIGLRLPWSNPARDNAGQTPRGRPSCVLMQKGRDVPVKLRAPVPENVAALPWSDS